MIFPQPLKAASFARVMAAPLSLLENPRPATRVAGRKTASGIFLRRPPARARKNRSQVAQLRRVKKPAATKTASGRGFWTATDPIKFKAGDVNLYRYAGNSVLNLTDPDGQAVPLVIGGVVIGISALEAAAAAAGIGILACTLDPDCRAAAAALASKAAAKAACNAAYAADVAVCRVIGCYDKQAAAICYAEAMNARVRCLEAAGL